MFARLGVSIVNNRFRYLDAPIRGENAKALLQSAEMQSLIAPYVSHVAKMGFYPDVVCVINAERLILTCEHDSIDVFNARIIITDADIYIEIRGDIYRNLTWEEFKAQHYVTKKFLKKSTRAKTRMAALKERVAALEAENAALHASNETLRADIEERRLRPGGEDYEAARERFTTQTYE